MNGYSSPTEVARMRYANSFASQIFDPPPVPRSPHYVPAGKRRDQTTSEMFGSDNDKDLRAMPETFVPRDDGRTARQKKLAFLSSDVLPMAEHMLPVPGPGLVQRPASSPGFQADGNDDSMDPILRRQKELHSELFGRPTPDVDATQIHSPGKRLTPTDFKWFNMPEPVHSPTEGDAVTYHDRAYHEKSSGLFDRSSPTDVHAPVATEPNDFDGDLKRKANVYYSDLFGRATPMAEIPGDQPNHPKHQCPVEDQIVVNQDWTDSKTELMRGTYRSQDESAADRRHDEFDTSHLFNHPQVQRDSSALEPIITDNSSKLRSSLGQGTQKIHQAHLQSSLMSPEFYDEAERPAAWEVVELNINGLPSNADDKSVKLLCNGFDLQIVKVTVEMDPVRNLCKGRAKLMLRYNPQRDGASINRLIDSLESRAQLKVQM